MFFNKIIKAATTAMFLSSFCFISCGNKEETPKTITEIVTEGANFTVLEAALLKSGLSSKFQNSGAFTVFAPTDEAFNAAGINTSFISGSNETTVKNLVNYHVLGQKMLSTDIQTADNTILKTLSDTAYLTKNTAGTFINGSKVTQADVGASNGVVHVIDRVMLPIYGDLVSTINNESSISLFAEAISQTGVDLALYKLKSATVFAPNNAAFAALDPPFNTLTGLKSLTTAQIATLKNIISYHIISERAYTPNLKTGSLTTLLTGKALTVNVDNGIKITGLAANNSASLVTTSPKNFNITAFNGVIHTVNKVLLPQ